jgi:Domain of unknown function (DUF1918)
MARSSVPAGGQAFCPYTGSSRRGSGEIEDLAMTEEPVMKAQVGDELIVKGQHVGDPDRRGVITEVHGEDGGPPYQVRWSDGHESSFFPSSGTVVEHVQLPARGQTRAA